MDLEQRIQQYCKRANAMLKKLFKDLDKVTVIRDKELIEDQIVELIVEIKQLGGTPFYNLNDLNKKNGHTTE